ncbi:MAG: Gfo/Idh/MocA family oxidoreductase [Anaerolineae bacterium]|nr:Gfo/Idh/MocA family oxidoreductase [Anaerolineae bacterium]
MAELKIGIVGLDTSHVKAFTEIINNPENPYHIPGGRVTCAYPGGTDAFSLSRNRVHGFTTNLIEQYHVEMVANLRDLVERVDAVLLESVDGRQHLEQFQQLAVGKPVYIDKPLATSLNDAKTIQHIAHETRTPLMSCSSLRYASGIYGLVPDSEQVISCEAFGPAALLDDYPGLFWYGIHSAEVLFSFMGTGCKAVQLVASPHVDIVIGEWQDGRMGILRGTRFEKGEFGCVVHTSQQVYVSKAQPTPPYYATMLEKVMAFFKSGPSPIPDNETLEIIAFLEAADLSRNRGGQKIDIHLH